MNSPSVECSTTTETSSYEVSRVVRVLIGASLMVLFVGGFFAVVYLLAPGGGKVPTAYYIEVETGRIGKPDLKIPKEFWRGTGYDASLKPKNW